ncbi:LOW QUALITY PROTEIN: E3 ubiquitin-protein ligase TRIM8b [Chanos chanos]|uniref:LOW QUALITY PROTEIN: E3 ubiquitin-protein ligase TRIM8b n=1 Tax=Chanos chanos TaxID=29144 RepID=A0A6J2VCZ6_CHACN|nr:LOW QUALITY PROTEIN: E3 ubiquitin-protein ligase TRIM8-like [Chanos chanos]
MEMAEMWKSCLEEELICPICLHTFTEPVQLPCKHNFCRVCINEAWSKDAGMVRCPECNHGYSQKPSLDKNHKLSNIVEKFNALNVEKTPTVLQCILCRRGPPLPAQKVCLRCKAPCCLSHVQTHLQQPSSNLGHLLVDAGEVRAWSCPQHDEYRLYHCETEQVAVCQYCCFSRCAANHGHAVCDVEVRRNDIRQMLVKQQDRMEERVQDVEEQLYKLDSDKCLVEDKVQQLKEEVQLQYQKMHQLLEEDLAKTLEVLDKAQSKFCQENSAQALQLSEQQQDAKKLLGRVQAVFDKTDDVNFMKNTKSMKILMDRCQSCVGNSLPPHKVGNLNSRLFLSELSKREKSLAKMLEVPFSPPASFLQTVPAYLCGVSGSGVEKRRHSVAFPDSSGSSSGSRAGASFMDSSSSTSSSAKQPYLGAAPPPGEGQSSQQTLGPCGPAQHVGGAGAPGGSQSIPHSGSVLPHSHYPNGGTSQLSQYGGRKILMCTVDNCYCSGMPSVSSHRGGHPPYPRSGSFPWPVSSQEYSTHPLPPAPAMSQPLQSLTMRDWIDASQSHRHADFYSLYGQSSAKHYVTS